LEQTLDAPYLDTALLLHSYPPVIIGGDDDHGVPTSLMYIAILDIHEKGDMEQSSFFFYSKELCCSSANQYCESILVIAGTKGGIGFWILHVQPSAGITRNNSINSLQ